MQPQTPYYLIDEHRMSVSMEKIRYVKENSGASPLLALKCFSSWCCFPFMRNYLAGTTSSSLYEARLGYEKFGGETHGYAVAWDEHEVREAVDYCDKIIFNSVSQLDRHHGITSRLPVGLRLNPEVGSSHYELSNPVIKYSRLGARSAEITPEVARSIDGAMVHINCENDDLPSFARQLAVIEERFASLLPQISWVSLGGGIAFTDEGYPLDELCRLLREFAERHSIKLYLEPGEAAVKNSTSLVVTVLDVVNNIVPTVIVDAGVETHLLDVLTYGFTPELEGATPLPRDSQDLELLPEPNVVRVCGRTCLSGDLFGNYSLSRIPSTGDTLRFTDVAGYSMVKKNFFNGLRMPSVWHRTLAGDVRKVQEASYEDFVAALTEARPFSPETSQVSQ